MDIATDNLEAPETAVEDNAVLDAPDTTVSDGTDFEAGMNESLRQAEGSEDQQDTPVDTGPAQEPLYAGKFKQVSELEKAYDGLQRMLGEDGRYKPEVERLQKELEQVRAQAAQLAGIDSRESTEEQQPAWQKEWESNPLTAMPDPLLQADEHKAWLEKVFTPHFLNRPVQTIQHFVRPELERIREEVKQEFLVREQQAQVSQAVSNYWNSKADWSGEKTVSQALNDLPAEAVTEFETMLSKGYPQDAAAELIYRRHTTGKVAQQSEQISARDQELRELASGPSNRGPAPATARRKSSNPLDFQGNMAEDLMAQGVELPNFTPQRPL